VSHDLFHDASHRSGALSEVAPRRPIASAVWLGVASSWSRRSGTGSNSCPRRTAFYVDLLAEKGPLLGEPYSRQLDGKLRELRFHLERAAVRVTYWIAPARRMVLLTVFTKTRMRQDREIDRARRALARCLAEQHTVD
jgi:hypothetical protein